MPLPTVFAGLSTATGADLDGNFDTMGEFSVIPCAISGTNVLTLTPASNTPTLSGYVNYMVFAGIVATTNTGAVTASAGGFAVLNVYYDSGSGPAALTGGELEAGTYVQLAYDSALNSSAGGFHIVGSTFTTKNIAAGTGINTAINNGTVTVSSAIVNYGGGPGAAVTINSGTVTISTTESVLALTSLVSSLSATSQSVLTNFTGVGSSVGTLLVAGTEVAGFFTDILPKTVNNASYEVLCTGGAVITQPWAANSSLYLTDGQAARIIANGTNYAGLLYSPFRQSGLASDNSIILTHFGCLDINGGVSTAFSGKPAINIGNNNNVGSTCLAVAQNSSANTTNFNVAIGSGVTAKGGSSLSVGNGTSLSGANSFGSGSGGQDFVTTNARVLGGSGSNFQIEIPLSGTGSSTSAIRLTSDGGAATVKNIGTIPAGYSAAYKVVFNIQDTTTKGAATFIGQQGTLGEWGTIGNLGSVAANTTIAAGHSFAVASSIGSIAAIGTGAISADTTLGGPNIAYTPGAGNTSTIDVSGLLTLIYTK